MRRTSIGYAEAIWFICWGAAAIGAYLGAHP